MHRAGLFIALLAAVSGVAAPASAATITAATSVDVRKAVQLTKLQDLDFGTLTFTGFTGNRTLTISQSGVFACAVDIVCGGAPKAARFNIQGTNKETVKITVTGGSMTNGSDTIPFTADAPAFGVYLPNSGQPGVDFGVGGSIIVSTALLGGVYGGTLNVTADYQ